MTWSAFVLRMPKAGASLAWTGVVATVTSALCASVVGEHGAVVHAVELVPREDRDVLVGEAADVGERLPDGVGRALVPCSRRRRLLGREHGDEPTAELVEPVGPREVAVEAGRVELGEDEDPVEPGVEAVRDRDVDEPVLPGEGDGGLGAVTGEGEEPRPGASTEDDGERLVHEGEG